MHTIAEYHSIILDEYHHVHQSVHVYFVGTKVYSFGVYHSVYSCVPLCPDACELISLKLGMALDTVKLC